MKHFISSSKLILTKYAALVLVFGFLGWVFETTVVLLTLGQLTNRGYLFALNVAPKLMHLTFLNKFYILWGMPFIEMYGLGALLIYLLCNRYKGQYLKLFFSGMFFMTLFELIGGIFCKYVLRHEYWSYKQEFLNFRGFICLQSSVAWGVLTIFLVQFVFQHFEKWDDDWSEDKYYYVTVWSLIVYAIFCAILKYVLFPGKLTMF